MLYFALSFCVVQIGEALDCLLAINKQSLPLNKIVSPRRKKHGTFVEFHVNLQLLKLDGQV